jgi:hypothetical protein
MPSLPGFGWPESAKKASQPKPLPKRRRKPRKPNRPKETSDPPLPTRGRERLSSVSAVTSEWAIPAEVWVDPAEYRKVLRIDTGKGIELLGKVMEPWQRRDFEAMDSAWQCVAYPDFTPAEQPPRRAYLERPRGHSKTNDIAVMVSWVLASSEHQINGDAIAADREQARLLKRAIDRICRFNPWVGCKLKITRNRVENVDTKSVMTILSSDSSTVYGTTPDFIVADELTHWPSEEMWSAIFSASAKRPRSVMVVIANAGAGQGKPDGEGGSWQWRVREGARLSPRWYFHWLDGPQASWITEDDLTEQRSFLPPKAFRRLWMNQWTTEGGDALDAADIEAACRLLRHQEGPYPGWIYGCAFDLSTKHHHSAFVMLGTLPGTGRVTLARIRSWKASESGGTVDLQAVEADIVEDIKGFGPAFCAFDPSQAVLLAQRLERQTGCSMIERAFIGKEPDKMARDLLTAFRTRRIDIWRHEELLYDLRQLSIIERKWGMKIEAPSDRQHGHADRAIALLMCLGPMLEFSEQEPENLTSSGLPDQLVT